MADSNTANMDYNDQTSNNSTKISYYSEITKSELFHDSLTNNNENNYNCKGNLDVIMDSDTVNIQFNRTINNSEEVNFDSSTRKTELLNDIPENANDNNSNDILNLCLSDNESAKTELSNDIPENTNDNNSNDILNLCLSDNESTNNEDIVNYSNFITDNMDNLLTKDENNDNNTKNCNESIVNDTENTNENYKLIINRNENKPNTDNIKKMLSVFGLLCLSFKSGPYEFTLTTMSYYITGICDPKQKWLKNLDFYIKKLNITELYVMGCKQGYFISNFIKSVPIYDLTLQHLPTVKRKCSICRRYGCSTFKASNILQYNFNYRFNIPCSYLKL